MFRLPKTSQSPGRKNTNTVVNRVVKESKNTGLCKFAHRKCNFVCLDNYNYCLKHILEDKSAPYKPCPFLYTVSGKKCGKPALRQDRKDSWFCAVHNRKSHLQRQRALSRHAPPKTQEALFATLGHYVPSEQPTVKKEITESEDPLEKETVKAVDPFVDIDASQVNTRVSQVLDYVSESDSDVETAMLDSVWRAQDHESSDAESVDSQNEDPLKHAGTYTAEEVTVIIKDKMLRLQSLYIDQFRRLHHLLKEKRRKYLHTIKKEKETLCSIHDQEKQTAREQKLYQKLKALNRYHKHYGVEAVLHKKALELRAQVTEGHVLRTSHKGKCAFTEGGVKCGAKTLPVTKYCRKHILEDTQQVLFRSCGVKRDDHICLEPTLNVFENSTCVYHTVLPAQPHDRLGKLVSSEDQTSEGTITQTSQNETENSFVNIVDSEELLIKEILKPTDMNSVGKPEAVDALELSRTVSDILALAEAHSSSTGISETSDKTFIEQNIVATSSELSKPLLDQSLEPSSGESVSPTTEKRKEAIPSEFLKPELDQKMETSSIETCDEKNTSLCEKMEVEEKTKQSVSLSKELENQENSDELVMIDMMTDVGVVEEVLESEQVAIEDSEEVVGSENEVVGEKQEAVNSDQVEELDQKGAGPPGNGQDSNNQEIETNLDVVDTEQLVETQLQTVKQEVSETKQNVVETQQVAETQQEVVDSNQQSDLMSVIKEESEEPKDNEMMEVSTEGENQT